jgi:hypothetical protein
VKHAAITTAGPLVIVNHERVYLGTEQPGTVCFLPTLELASQLLEFSRGTIIEVLNAAMGLAGYDGRRVIP